MSSNETKVPTRSDNNKRKLIISVFLIIALFGAGNWIYKRFTHVYTDDARVSADMIDISSKVSGWIVDFPVSSGDILQQGEMIAMIDSRATTLKLQELDANVAAMTADYQGQQAEIKMVEKQTSGALQAASSQLNEAQAALSSANSELEFRASEWKRSQTLRNKSIISLQDYESAQTSYRKAKQAREVAIGNVAQARAKLIESEANQSRLLVMERNLAKFQFQRDSLHAQLERERIDLSDRRITAPSHGIVDRVFVDNGEYVQPGQRLAILHNPEKIWVSANIKETEIRHIEVGQRVVVSVDAYPDLEFIGKVAKIGHAATSQFSLLPSTNPSGNFTKITQRLSIKIELEQQGSLLKPGMMAEVAIDVR